jgi:polyisoprenoid-binding protein YceI
MRRISLSLTACIFAVAASLAPAPAQTSEPPSAQRAIDAAKSRARFAIAHIFVERVIGTVPILSGTLALPPGSTIPSSLTAVLDPAHFDTGEPDRDASLESADYFDVKKFPTWTFTSTRVVPQGPSAFGVDGVLTMHGVSQPEHLDVSVRGDASHPVYHALGHVDRHGFGMKGARLDPVIGDVADITLDIVLKPNPAAGGAAK